MPLKGERPKVVTRCPRGTASATSTPPVLPVAPSTKSFIRARSPAPFDIFNFRSPARPERRHLAAVGLEHHAVGGIRSRDGEIVSAGDVLVRRRGDAGIKLLDTGLGVADARAGRRRDRSALTSTRATRPSWSITQSPRGAFVSTAYLHPLVTPLGAA